MKLAKDTEEDSSFDLKLLIDYYSSEGQKYYGPDYVFHESEKEQKTDDNFDITLNKQINKPTHKHNKSDTISDFSKNLTNNVDSDDKSVNNKISKLFYYDLVYLKTRFIVNRLLYDCLLYCILINIKEKLL